MFNDVENLSHVLGLESPMLIDRIRSTGEGIIFFNGVCHSVHPWLGVCLGKGVCLGREVGVCLEEVYLAGGGSAWSGSARRESAWRGSAWKRSAWRGLHADPRTAPPYGKPVVDMHPTGMHSCCAKELKLDLP